MFLFLEQKLHQLGTNQCAGDKIGNEAEIVDSLRYDHLGTPATSLGEVNVENFGSEGDGETDDKVFKKAWEETSSSNTAVLVVPKVKKYHVKPITFSGPCKSDSVTLKILGTIEASDDPSDYANHRWQWNDMVKKLIQNQQNSTLYRGTNGGILHSMRQLESEWPQNSENVQIIESVITTGDDCISIVNGSKNVEAIDVTCGPGHGISVGILGGGNSEAQVSNVLVD
ncbi:unnamed protein product, partial [Vitis vinifera]